MQSLEEGFLGLALQITRFEHVAVEFLEFDPDLHNVFVVVLCHLAMGLLDAVRLVQQGGVCGLPPYT